MEGYVLQSADLGEDIHGWSTAALQLSLFNVHATELLLELWVRELQLELPTHARSQLQLELHSIDYLD